MLGASPGQGGKTTEQGPVQAQQYHCHGSRGIGYDGYAYFFFPFIYCSALPRAATDISLTDSISPLVSFPLALLSLSFSRCQPAMYTTQPATQHISYLRCLYFFADSCALRKMYKRAAQWPSKRENIPHTSCTYWYNSTLHWTAQKFSVTY
jgi:hypothetical protein